MKISAKQLARALVVTSVGSLDALTAPQLADFLRAQVEGGQARLVLNLGETDFMSSAGLRVILEILKRCRRQGGDLRLAAVRPGVAKTLEMAGFARLLQVYPTLDEAEASFFQDVVLR